MRAVLQAMGAFDSVMHILFHISSSSLFLRSDGSEIIVTFITTGERVGNLIVCVCSGNLSIFVLSLELQPHSSHFSNKNSSLCVRN